MELPYSWWDLRSILSTFPTSKHQENKRYFTSEGARRQIDQGGKILKGEDRDWLCPGKIMMKKIMLGVTCNIMCIFFHLILSSFSDLTWIMFLSQFYKCHFHRNVSSRHILQKMMLEDIPMYFHKEKLKINTEYSWTLWKPLSEIYYLLNTNWMWLILHYFFRVLIHLTNNERDCFSIIHRNPELYVLLPFFFFFEEGTII